MQERYGKPSSFQPPYFSPALSATRRAPRRDMAGATFSVVSFLNLDPTRVSLVVDNARSPSFSFSMNNSSNSFQSHSWSSSDSAISAPRTRTSKKKRSPRRTSLSRNYDKSLQQLTKDWLDQTNNSCSDDESAHSCRWSASNETELQSKQVLSMPPPPPPSVSPYIQQRKRSDSAPSRPAKQVSPKPSCKPPRSPPRNDTSSKKSQRKRLDAFLEEKKEDDFTVQKNASNSNLPVPSGMGTNLTVVTYPISDTRISSINCTRPAPLKGILKTHSPTKSPYVNSLSLSVSEHSPRTPPRKTVPLKGILRKSMNSTKSLDMLGSLSEHLPRTASVLRNSWGCSSVHGEGAIPPPPAQELRKPVRRPSPTMSDNRKRIETLDCTSDSDDSEDTFNESSSLAESSVCCGCSKPIGHPPLLVAYDSEDDSTDSNERVPRSSYSSRRRASNPCSPKGDPGLYQHDISPQFFSRPYASAHTRRGGRRPSKTKTLSSSETQKTLDDLADALKQLNDSWDLDVPTSLVGKDLSSHTDSTSSTTSSVEQPPRAPRRTISSSEDCYQ